MAKNTKTNGGGGKLARAIAITRILIGLIFVWAFMDKMFGLGFATCATTDAKTQVKTVQVGCKKAWIKGGSPTTGFLKFGAKGPLKGTFNSMADNKVLDVLFMLGLLGIGVALTLGIGIKIAVVSGSILLFLMWLAELWPANHPFIDDHIVYIAMLWVVGAANSDQALGLGKWWRKQDIVKKNPILI